jgi:CHAD domain-containing protein
MSYEIKVHGRIGCALQDLAHEEATFTLQTLTTLQTGTSPEATHEVRKQVKKIRALLALLREPLGKKRYHEEESTLKKVGKALGPVRDAECRSKTLKQLQRRFFPGKPSALIKAVQGTLADQERRCLAQLSRSNALAAGVADLKIMLPRIAAWPVSNYGWKELRQAVHRSYERARIGYRKAYDAPTTSRLHRWRRRVKELWFHVQLLRRVSPAFMEELAQDFEVLGEFLGDDHDLIVLKTALEERKDDGQGAALETLLELIDLRREELLDAAFDLGERLHEDSPEDYIRELDEWRTTRRERRRKAKKLGSQLIAAAE